MRQPAVCRFGGAGFAACALLVTSVALAACGGGQSAPPHEPLENHVRSTSAHDGLVGAYWCSITDSGFRYPRFPCVIRDHNGRLLLAKLAGSQRFRGELVQRGDALAFSGEFYCPWGDCTQSLHGTFRTDRHGNLHGAFRDASFTVELTPTDVSAFGGAGYGGAGYGEVGYRGVNGGYGYGGLGYGGATYGQYGIYGGAGYGGAGYGRNGNPRRPRQPLPAPAPPNRAP